MVNALKEEIFYGTLYLKTDSGVQEIDARPSDAIALALHDMHYLPPNLYHAKTAP